jgi:hypothetical protein
MFRFANQYLGPISCQRGGVRTIILYVSPHTLLGGVRAVPDGTDKAIVYGSALTIWKLADGQRWTRLRDN